MSSQSVATCTMFMLLQEANQRNVDPLQPHEIRIIHEQLRFLGKQPKRWEIIVNQHLPYRTVSHVSKLWAAHQASLQQSGPGESTMMSWSKCITAPRGLSGSAWALLSPPAVGGSPLPMKCRRGTL